MLYILLNNPKVTINQLAKRCKVSSRTIRSDLKKLEEKLNCIGVILHKKPGVGVWLESEYDKIMWLKEHILKAITFKSNFSPSDRRKEIIKILLEDKSYNCSLLAQELYVSKSTISKDLGEIRKWLSNYNLTLQNSQQSGIEIKGEERHLRVAIVEILFRLMKQADLEEISKLLEDNHSVNPKDYEVLKDFSAEVDLKKIKEIIYSQEIKGKFLFTQISILAIIFYISISIKRFKQGKKIKLLEKDIIRLKRLKLFKLAKIIGKKAEEEFGFLILEDELCGTFIQFLCANIYYDNTLTTKEEISKRINKTVMEISRRFIDLVEDELGVNLADDINLFLDLILHVRHIYNHFRYQVPKIVVNELDNIILNRIKENNPNIIEISNKIIDIFSQYQINILSERDIDYIAILLLSAVEKFTEKTKAIIINNETFAINELMINRLISSISNLEIIDHIYNQDINHKKLKGADLIITSNQLVTLPEAIVISPLVKQEDIQLIRSRIKLLAEDKAL
ncbi:hypothetical protein U472_07965 [Orenia metallireducens]|uniref:Transcriptional antiterminator n=1 Tax=Orenia metallireducens TaxID=1413210 RepID=A0A1C0AAR6_9FIRM|nr:hypothetical protein U472_07965 [Orenia metallireducens]